MSQRSLLERFAEWQAAGEPLALVTVVATEGSTYSKAGRHLLIRIDGEHAGLVSGGCLEGDLADHAREVIATGASKLLTYDMRDDADAIWGMGVGCNGLIEVLVQKLDPAQQWAPFDSLAAAIESESVCTVSLVTQSENSDLPVGSVCIRDESGAVRSGIELPAPPEALPAPSAASDATLIHWSTLPWPRLLLLGAGPDAEPVCSMAAELGWEVCVADHRPALIESFSNDGECLVIEPARLHDVLELGRFSACLVMSHHLETDSVYLQQLALHFGRRPGRYLGVLGPAARRERILESLTQQPEGFAQWLRGPVGLDIGADSPESIALAVLAEIQACHMGKAGGAL